MRVVTKRDLNQHTAAVLEQAADAGGLVVTERGEPRWRVTAFREESTVLERMEREGKYVPPSSAPAPWSRDVGGPAYSDAEVDALLEDLKGDR